MEPSKSNCKVNPTRVSEQIIHPVQKFLGKARALSNDMVLKLRLRGTYHFVGLLDVLMHLFRPRGLVVALGAGFVRLAVVAILQFNGHISEHWHWT